METKKLSLQGMEMVEGGASFAVCIGVSAFSVGLFVAGMSLATTVTAGAAAVAVIGLYGGIGLSCLT